MTGIKCHILHGPVNMFDLHNTCSLPPHLLKTSHPMLGGAK